MLQPVFEAMGSRTLHVGDSFLVPRGVAHNGVNVGKVPARLLITFVTDKDVPLRTAVPAPAPEAAH